MTSRVLALLLLALLPYLTALAQDIPADPPRFATAGTGLPSSVVTALAEDSTGFIWMGTARGLVRFDGHRFRLYGNRWSTAPDETSLFVRSLLADRDGALWVGTDFVGLARYEPGTDRLLPVDTSAVMPASFSVNALAMDSQGQLWIGTDDQGLLVRSRDGELKRVALSGQEGLPEVRIECLLIDRHGTLWVGSWGGLARLAPGETTLAPIALDGSNTSVTMLFEADDGHVWIGTREGRLWRTPADGLAPQAVTPDSPETSAASVYAMLQASPDQLWIGRASGVEVRAASDGHLLYRLRHQPGNPVSLASGEVHALLRDRGGQFWVGSYGGGVQRHNSLNTAFRLRDRLAFAEVDNAPDDLNVRAITVLADGRILLGTQDRGIAVLDAQLRPLGALHDASGQPLLRGVRITGLAETVDGALWIGSDAGVFRRATESAPLQSFALEGGRVRRLLADPAGGLWLATEDGLWRHRPGATQLERKHGGVNTPLRGDINALSFDSAGRLWIGGESGLALLDTPEAEPRRVLAAHPARGYNPDVLGLLVAAEDSVWFDTPSGLFRVRIDADGNERVEAISQKYDLPGRPFGANLLHDAQSRLWTQNHVLDSTLGRVLTLGPSDGAELGSPWFRAYAKTRDGILLFGGTQSLLAILPEQFHFSENTPPLAITDLRINGVAAPQAYGQDGLILTPGQRSLAIEFAALDYNAPDRIRYAYRLLGESENWTEVDADYRVATFANLAPGDYRFELRSSNRSGRFDNRSLSIPLRVEPAWWQTWWTQIGAVILLGALVNALIHQRTRWLRKRQHELERHVATRTRELQEVSITLREKSQALEEASLTDPLTGLRNRRYFAAHIEGDVAESLRRHETALADGSSSGQADLLFFLIDIDHFKQVNDVYGHAAGDAVLMQVADRLRACFRDSDHLVRWGGEEFLVVARHMTRQHAAELADRVVRTIAATPFELPDRRRLYCSCSLGHAVFPLQPCFPHQTSWTDVVEMADLALYAAKRGGRNGRVGLTCEKSTALPPDWRHRLPEMLDSGHLSSVGSLPPEAVRRALLENPPS